MKEARDTDNKMIAFSVFWLYLRGSCDVCNGTTVSKALQYQC